MALLLALVACASGTLLTYCYDETAPLHARLAAGTGIGYTALALVGLGAASFIGLTPVSLTLAGLIVAAPLVLLVQTAWRARVAADVRAGAAAWRLVLTRPSWRGVAPGALFALAAVVCWFVFTRACFVRGGEWFTGVENNLGDLPFHLAIITSFAHGANFPPQHPEFAGARLTYPFLVDFLAAMFVRAGASLAGALFWEGFTAALALVVLLYRCAFVWTRTRAAALLSVALTLLSGGLGWHLFVREWLSGPHTLFELLGQLPHKYTISYDNVYRWGNAVTTLLVPQRALLLGLPLALVVITQWWQALTEAAEPAAAAVVPSPPPPRARARGKTRGKKGAARVTAAAPPPLLLAGYSGPLQRMLGAGLVAGLMPLAHAHSFVVLMVMGVGLALLFPRWRLWFVFYLVVSVAALPQMWWATRGSAAQASSFFAWQFGWDSGAQDVLWFWFINTGLFIPALVAALAWRGPAPVVPPRLLRFYLPFTLCFVGPNVAKISPYIWDNIKVLFYWYLASTPLVALLLVRLWPTAPGRGRGAARPTVGGVLRRAGVGALFVVLTLAGTLDVWRVVSGGEEQREFDREGVAFAEVLKQQTPPRALILTAPTYNHPVYLTGRRALLGYGGHLWSQGIDYVAREAEVSRIYAGAPDASALLTRYGVEYIVVGPLERATLPAINEQFFTRFAQVGDTGAYRLYKVQSP